MEHFDVQLSKQGSRVTSYNKAAADSRKQGVSVRMSRSDVRHIKRLAERLGVRDSDVIRFAIKVMLTRLAPLQDPSVRGRNLVPVFLESGMELMRHFELDAATLSTIINDGVEQDCCVDPADIQLLAMSGTHRSYVKLRMAGLRREQSAESANANPDADNLNGNGNGRATAAEDLLDDSLRRYLYEKYLFGSSPSPASNLGGGT